MTLKEYLRNHKENEVVVWDDVWDMETYFNYATKEECKDDDWNKGMMILASKLNVVKEGTRGVVVNLTQVIENSMDELMKEDLFIDNEIDAIMDDMMSILSGYVSERWLLRFATTLKEA